MCSHKTRWQVLGAFKKVQVFLCVRKNNRVDFETFHILSTKECYTTTSRSDLCQVSDLMF